MPRLLTIGLRYRIGTLSLPALAACLALVARGGSSSPGASSPSATPTPAAQSATRPAEPNAPPAPSRKPTPRAANGSARHAGIIRRCASTAAGSPASMEECLVARGLTVQASGAMYTCLQSAGDGAAVTACLTKFAQ